MDKQFPALMHMTEIKQKVGSRTERRLEINKRWEGSAIGEGVIGESVIVESAIGKVSQGKTP